VERADRRHAARPEHRLGQGGAADNAATSPFFGNVYECDNGNRSHDPKTAPQPVVFSRSSDGGASWEAQQLSSADDPVYHGVRFGGRLGCTIRTDSAGAVYVAWQGNTESRDLIYLARSFDGGAHFRAAKPVVALTPCGAHDPASGWQTFDGIGGTRAGSFPQFDVANGAPTGASATDEIVLAFCDAGAGLGSERALVITSFDGGETWSAPVDATASGDRPDMPAVAIAPGGADLYVTYDAFLTGWQNDTAQARPFQGVVRHARADDPGSWTDLHRGVIGDARATSRSSLEREFIYDYISVTATETGAVATWLDGRGAADCPAIDAYRASLATAAPLPAPDPLAACPPTFGNLDVYAGAYAP
jgi:hypothetical protein